VVTQFITTKLRTGTKLQRQRHFSDWIFFHFIIHQPNCKFNS